MLRAQQALDCETPSTTAVGRSKSPRRELRSHEERRDERDRYFMALARAVRGRDNVSGGDDEQPAHAPHHGANCYGSKIGAVLVLGDRVISTGYNGTPAGMLNCIDGGCLRCKDRYLEKLGETSKMSDPSHTAGAALDRCICVHAEQNALLAAARFGTRVEGATLYTTLSPCFGCLNFEALGGDPTSPTPLHRGRRGRRSAGGRRSATARDRLCPHRMSEP